MRDLYSEVSERIRHQLEVGSAPWVKPWASTPGLNTPCNAATGRPYSGCNVILLWIAGERGWATPRFVTFKQALELGGNVRKGEHGTKVYYFKQLHVKDKREGAGADAERVIPLMREYTVFNVAQCENLPERITNPAPAKARNPNARDVDADAFMASTKADIREGAGEAYYVPSKDFVSLPAFVSFKSAGTFYNTAFHELGHWTGAKARLARELASRFKGNGQAYAAEELIAELCSAFLCAEFSFDGELRHADYIASWISLLREDKRAFFTACSAAQKAADYLRGLALAEAADVEQEAEAA